MQVLIVYDSSHAGCEKNLCFQEEMRSKGYYFSITLARMAMARGINIVTSDVFLSEKLSYDIAYCFTDMHSTYTEKVLMKGAIPLICFSMESPLVARRFYMNIKNIAGRYKYNVQFKGTFERLRYTNTDFSIMYYPIEKRQGLAPTSWEGKRLLVLVNRNKRAFFSETGSFMKRLRSYVSRFLMYYQKVTDPWINSKELYKDRIRLIYHFSKSDKLDLFGEGWNDPIKGFSRKYQIAAKKVYKGPLTDKLSKMNQYKFAICFENCCFPGYVTEKIFDCFLAGCIPVYFGAPDITEFVPENTFIDFRKFESLEQLERELDNFTEKRGEEMLKAAREFLESKDFDKYYVDRVADSFLSKIPLAEIE
jgi:hypothetical protein